MDTIVGILFWTLFILLFVILKRDGEKRVKEWVDSQGLELVKIRYRPIYFVAFIGGFHPETYVIETRNENERISRFVVSVGGLWFPFSRELRIHDIDEGM